MYRTALTLLGLTGGLTAVTLTGGFAQPPLPVVAPAGQPVASDYTPTKARTQKLGIVYTESLRKSIQQVRLCVSRDQGQIWQVEDAVTPDKDHFVFQAKDDGLYWLNMVIVFKDGKTDPPDVTRAPAAEKLLIDATPPVVRLTGVQRSGDEVAVEWLVEDKFPNDAATQLLVKPTGPTALGDYQPASVVTAPAYSVVRGEAGGVKVVKGTARIKAGSTGPVSVQVVAADLAGNTATAMKETVGGTVTAYTPAVPPVVPGIAGGTTTGGEAAPTSPLIVPTSPPVSTPSPGGGPSVPAMPVTVPAGPVATPVVPTEPAVTQAGAPPTAPMPAAPAQPAVVPTTPPVSPPTPAWTAQPPLNNPAPQPLPLNPEPTTGQPVPLTGTPSSPPTPSGPTQFVRSAQFDLQYQLDIGVSGVRQIDLYVTRDDGRTWVKWSQHDGRENPLRVNLAPRSNSATDGDYGLRLVPVNGAGLQDDPPTPGSSPDLRVHVDTTPPLISFYPPEPDPAQRNALLLKWVIKDRNVSESSPVAIEWSDTPNGPWRSVTGPDKVQPTGLGTAATAGPPKIANRGSYSWTLPANLPTHLVYFRFTAWDAAGNRSEGVTAAQSIDLVKPRARIQGIVTASNPATR